MYQLNNTDAGLHDKLCSCQTPPPSSQKYLSYTGCSHKHCNIYFSPKKGSDFLVQLHGVCIAFSLNTISYNKEVINIHCYI